MGLILIMTIVQRKLWLHVFFYNKGQKVEWFHFRTWVRKWNIKLKVEIVYLDVLTTKSNLSVFHKNEQEVVIRLKGILYKEGIKVKEVIVEESSSEISMSTLIVDEGGKFNQTSLSNALKKGCDKLITKLFEK